MEERLIKRLMTSMKCDSCGHHYEAYNVDVIGHREDLWFLKVLCSACHTQCLVAAVVREDKVLGAVTDLTKAELHKFRDNVIEGDDVLTMHNFMKEFDGDFSQLFGQK
jgi:MinD superfamily P-loop ATPase